MSATIHHLYRQPTEERSRLIVALDRIKANQERPQLRVVRNEPRDPQKWRRKYNAFLREQRTATCQICLGTGEIAVYGDFGEYEQPEPCPRCQRANPYTRFDPNEPAF